VTFIVIGGERRNLRVLDPKGTAMHLTNGAIVAKRVAGDTGDTILVVLGGDEPLDAADSFTAHVERFGERHTLAAELVDPDARTVLVQLDPWLPAITAPGHWGLEVVATADTTEITYPSAREDGVRIDVRADYG
jgi:hypothetical protein